MNACTCTGQGAVNIMAPTTDNTGTAAPGNDVTIYGPMCEYTCQRGYCPEGACCSVRRLATTPFVVAGRAEALESGEFPSGVIAG